LFAAAFSPAFGAQPPVCCNNVVVVVVFVGIHIVGYKPHIHEGKGILSHERGKREDSKVLLTQEEVCDRSKADASWVCDGCMNKRSPISTSPLYAIQSVQQ
jgi:hypothetical protein